MPELCVCLLKMQYKVCYNILSTAFGQFDHLRVTPVTYGSQCQTLTVYM